MRTWIAGIVVALGLCLALVAPQAARADTALGESSWSLEFGTDLGSGSGDYTIAIRRHSSASTAWRFGVEAQVSKSDGDGSVTETGEPSIGISRFYQDSDVAFTVHWMRFAQVRDNVTATFAVGAVFQRGRYVDRYDYASFGPPIDQSEYRTIYSRYGADLRLGVEWFFSRRMSLGGAVGLRAMLGTDTSVSISRNNLGDPTYYKIESETETDTRDLDTLPGLIYLTAYF